VGQEITSSQFGPEDFAAFKARLEAETRLLEQWFLDGVFTDGPAIGGFELECCLLDRQGDPAPLNQAFLERVDSPLVVPELATFNLEINSTARPLEGAVFSRMADELSRLWADCNSVAGALDARLGMLGILPTLRQQHLTLANMSPLNRYRALNEQVFKLRQGKPVILEIEGKQPLHLRHADVMLESATTSFQIHLQVNAEQAARIYNLSKIVSGPMVAVCANSPFLFGHELWEETRIPLFEQSISVGASDLTKRVSFGVRYVYQSILENFTANLQRYPVLLPHLLDEPVDRLAHLRLHNGTIWRWNRPLIGFDASGQPHLRIEHRVVPAGPSVIDCIANAALYFGLVTGLAATEDELERKLGFLRARSNFYAAARYGLAAQLFWMDRPQINTADLMHQVLLPQARAGLALLGVDAAEINQWLGVIEGRLARQQTGASWQRAWVEQHGPDMQGLTQAYLEHQQSGQPVHEWLV
jgi:gamma-glutamyl:cysteine ligase YbdK (ATP-grasp superfamily)